jgi:von Willebrand factor type A domain
VLLSDGVDDNGVGKQLSKHSVQDVLQFAKRMNVPIYAIGVGAEIDEALLAGFAQSTGGRYFLTPNASELKNLYDQIGIQLAGQYLISYTSNLPGDGSTREVQVRYQDSMSAKSYLAPSNTLAASTPAPAASPTKKKKESAGSGGLDAILGANGIKLQSNGKQIIVGRDGVSFSGDSSSAAENPPKPTPKANPRGRRHPSGCRCPKEQKGWLSPASEAGSKWSLPSISQSMKSWISISNSYPDRGFMLNL